MPKKNRRRSRRTVQYDFAEAPSGQVATEVDDETATEAPEPGAPGADYVRDVSPDGRAEKHVSRDYTHVRYEVVRIVVLGGALILGIVTLGFFR
ncbi:MAG: hypothetical protein J4O14_02435 [Chloroflexi bacterium]|nr:hypothetical protein [Chloroflexota bacterium]MCH7952925.1 hypothetical protein [Chloroflexota bacterium]MCI0782769.1 hypothetical protein [Chloroflexota bacterium]MCI0813839.1 hypothetical protein [Chloroflexota bacterium]MCI0817110.1 hypothetical protein [Chloroflexota bacterium]